MADKLVGTWAFVSVVTPGTAVQLSATEKRVTVLNYHAKKEDGANTGNIFLGDSTVDRTANQCFQIGNADGWGNFPITSAVNLQDLYIDAATAGDGIFIYYEEGQVV